ncbi:MAG: tetratricopeptide repeat protein [bacterium]|nr:tetratricopeptide repeat protein [bacterium]
MLVTLVVLISFSTPEAAYYRDKEIVDSVYFSAGRLELDKNARQQLDRIAARIKDLEKDAEAKGESLVIRLEGYSDSSGDEEMNLFYSMLRASMVEEYLIDEKGLTLELYLTGFGESKVATPEKNEAERRQNRRVDVVRILGGGEKLKVFRMDKPVDAARALKAPPRLKPPKIVTFIGQDKITKDSEKIEPVVSPVKPEKPEIVIPEEWNRQGVDKVKSGDYTGAVSLFLRALEADDSYTGARFNLAFTYQRMGRINEAKEQYKKILETKNMAKVHLMLGIIYEKEGDDGQAIDEFEKVLNIDPANETATRHLESLEKAAEKEVTEKVNAYNREGAAYVKSGNYEGAIASFEKALELDPQNEGANFNRAYTLQQMERYDEAVEGYMRILTVKETAKPLFMLGVIYENKKDYNNAAWFYQKAHDKAPSNKRIKAGLDRMNEELKPVKELLAEGASLLKEKKYAQAVAKFEKASLKDPANYKTHCNLGLTYLSSARYDSAIAAFNRCVEIKDGANAHLLLGIAYDRKGDAESAKREFELVLEKDPDNKKARKYLNQ